MIHIHVIITAVILLVTAFAALIICLCVDIIPVIKSRGSTLASRDSVTKDQTKKLKKSLLRSKKLADQEEVEIVSSPKAKDIPDDSEVRIEECKENQIFSSSATTLTKVTTTTLTTTVSLEPVAAIMSNCIDKNCVAIHQSPLLLQRQSQSTDTAQLQHADNRQHRRTASDSQHINMVNNLTPVAVSVHEQLHQNNNYSKMLSGLDTAAGERMYLHNQSELHSPNSDLPQYGYCHSAPTSPNTATSRKKLPMVSQSRRIHSGNAGMGPTIDNNELCNLRSDFQHGIKEGVFLSPQQQQQLCNGLSYGDHHQNPGRKFSDCTDYKLENASNNLLLPWDYNQDISTVKQERANCKCSHNNQHLDPNKRLKDYTGNQCNSSVMPNINRFQGENKASQRVHRQDDLYHSTNPSRHACGEGHCSTCVPVQTSLLTTTWLHGSGCRLRSSPQSSSSSPSSLSSSSYSGPRNRRTKLEDIQEDISDADVESVAQATDTFLQKDALESNALRPLLKHETDAGRKDDSPLHSTALAEETRDWEDSKSRDKPICKESNNDLKSCVSSQSKHIESNLVKNTCTLYAENISQNARV
ncbi:unnamed protein product [Clavelina lepadiformis]|uniref:Uncharacterized protein n=1 Tax=Clavelina lepadiformis TaxID=159417 RepID=A0ABP0GFD1_CLALP